MKKIVASILTLSLSFVLAGNASAGKAQYWYLDSDGDGFGNPSISVYTNKPDFNYVVDNTDCNDDPTNGSNVYPGANEVVGDGIDQNCDNVDNCFQDNDLDTYGTDIVLVGTDLTCTNFGESVFNTDCNDSDVSINPSIQEDYTDNIDQNCDGLISPYFVDPNLEACVLYGWGGTGGSFDPVDLANISGVKCSNIIISDLTGMEYLTGLYSFELDTNRVNPIDDLSPLASLTNLVELHIPNTLIDDLTPLSNLTGLTRLYINTYWTFDVRPNAISDLTPLSNLSNLTRLSVSGEMITDLAPLSNLSNLEILSIAYTSVSDLTPLADLTGIFQLTINDNPMLSTLAGLETLINLTNLTLFRNSISNIDQLAFTTNLVNLSLSWNSVSDLTPLTNLSNLRDLKLHDNLVSDVTPLANLSNLTYLALVGNSISDVTGLQNLTSIEYLYLGNNLISDLTPFSTANLPSLWLIQFTANSISDLTGLEGITPNYIDLYDNCIRDFDPVSHIPNVGGMDRQLKRCN